MSSIPGEEFRAAHKRRTQVLGILEFENHGPLRHIDRIQATMHSAYLSPLTALPGSTLLPIPTHLLFSINRGLLFKGQVVSLLCSKLPKRFSSPSWPQLWMTSRFVFLTPFLPRSPPLGQSPTCFLSHLATWGEAFVPCRFPLPRLLSCRYLHGLSPHFLRSLVPASPGHPIKDHSPHGHTYTLSWLYPL